MANRTLASAGASTTGVTVTIGMPTTGIGAPATEAATAPCSDRVSPPATTTGTASTPRVATHKVATREAAIHRVPIRRGGYGGYGGSGNYGSSPAAQNGYRDGYEQGRNDARGSNRFDPIGSRRYRSGDHDYDGRYGSRDDYKREYRAAFQAGYDEGYRGSRR